MKPDDKKLSAGGLVVVLASLALTACGFHLAGTRPLPEPLKTVHIDLVAPYRVVEPPVEASLRNRLLRRGSKVVEKPGAAVTTIKLTDLREDRSVLSVGSDGKALEFLLTTRVSYQVFSDGNALIAPDTLQVSRDYSFDEQQVLAKEAEEARLRDFIQDQLAEMLLIRIETRLQHLASVPAEPPRVVPTEVIP